MDSTQIDHIVLLVSTPFFENPPSWLTDNFTITPGGSHTGQASRNKLIIFADGTYLELFNWYDVPPSLDDESFPMRFWGPKKEGLIDLALTSTTTAEACIGDVNEMLEEEPMKDAGLGVRYQTPVAGSRTRGDDVEVKWKVTRPVFSAGENVSGVEMFPGGRMDVPFFCHDVTERGLRVACEDKAKTTHACGATGIAAIEVLVPEYKLEEYAVLWGKILGSGPALEEDDTSGELQYEHDVDVPRGVVERGGGRSKGIWLKRGGPKIVLKQAKSEKDLLRMKERGIGFSDLVIAVEGQGESRRRQCGTEGVAATIWLKDIGATRMN